MEKCLKKITRHKHGTNKGTLAMYLSQMKQGKNIIIFRKYNLFAVHR
jgi:hypothetical protein